MNNDFILNDKDFIISLPDSVPLFQRDYIQDVISKGITSIEDEAMGFLGEKKRCNKDWMLTGSGGDKDETSPVFNAIKNEIYDLMCTSSAKYSEVRKEGDIRKYINQAVTFIAGLLASSLHIAITAIAGAVSLLLFLAIKMGKNSWCSLNSPNKPE